MLWLITAEAPSLNSFIPFSISLSFSQGEVGCIKIISFLCFNLDIVCLITSIKEAFDVDKYFSLFIRIASLYIEQHLKYDLSQR